MARAPRGEPQRVLVSGNAYDARGARERYPASNPVEYAQSKFRDFQEGPDIPRPTLAQSFIPVVGPAWEAVADVQDGDYASAAFNGAMAVADMLPIGVAAKGARAASRGVGMLKNGSVTANAAQKMLKARGVVKPGYEVHHTIPLNGTGRTVQDPRNHFMFLKPLPQDQHRRLTGSWQGKPRYDPVRRVWYGTTDWMKAFPTAATANGLDAVENVDRRRPKRPR